MEVLYPRCAGLDVHEQMVVAGARLVEDGVKQPVESFQTTTAGILALADWLQEHGVTHVAMEATGVYWKPVWHVLEGLFELVLANAAHIKNVPGRKTDVNDALWIADLLAHGLIRASFVPPAPIQELRDLTRTRKQLVRERGRHEQRIDKILQDANLKIGSVLSDLLGYSGRGVLEALVRGESDPLRLLEFVHKRVKAPRAQVLEALRGHVTPHHRFMLKLHLHQVDELDQAITSIEEEAGEKLAPFRAAEQLLTSIPGVKGTAAAVIIAEVGVDMSRFPTAAHLISWAGLCPRNDESAGKRRSTRTRKSGQWLKTTLVQCAWAAARSKKSGYLRAQFLRLRARRGPKKAIVAVAASMLTAAYFMLKRGVPYEDLGTDHFDRADRTKMASRLVRKLSELGFAVELKRAA